MNELEKGSTMEGIMILLFLSIIIFAFVIPSKNLGPTGSFMNLTTGSPTYYGGYGAGYGNYETTYGPGYGTGSEEPSRYSRSINLTNGNAQYTVQPFEEYVNIYNSGTEPVDVTGWTFENSKDLRTYIVGGNVQKFNRDVRAIPQGVLAISNYPSLTDIVLKPGESAVVTSGKMGNTYPYRIQSFQENKCTGYLEDSGNYTFVPTLNRQCTMLSDEPGVNNTDEECQNLISTLQSCHAPKFDQRDRDGNICNGCVNGAPVTQQCLNFIKSHYSYEGCVAVHKNDPDFYLPYWRIFLGSDWEMWGAKRETISLYDKAHKLVDFISY